jgi:hypothetical protein
MPLDGLCRRILAPLALLMVVGLAPGGHRAEAAPVTYYATLSGAQVVPPVLTSASGFVQIVFESNTKRMDYSIILFGASAQDIAGAELREGAFGTNGSLTQKLAGAGWTQTTGALGLTDSQIATLNAGGFYVEVRSVSKGGPLVRGQILPPAVAGAQPVPPIPTPFPNPAPAAASSLAQGQAPAQAAVVAPRGLITPPSTGDAGLKRR